LSPKLTKLRISTSTNALDFARNPTTTIPQAASPNRDPSTRIRDSSPPNMREKNRNTNSTLPASCEYVLRSVSVNEGRPAKKSLFFVLRQDSDSNMSRPPITERLRKKNEESQIMP